MDENTKTIIDRARALLAAAGSKWDDVAVAGTPGGYWAVANARATYEAANADAALITAAPGLLATLCDALERSRFALEWWAADCAIGVEALREAWAVMDSMARAAGVVGAFLEQAAPLLRPDASGNVKAPNYVTATFTDGVQPYEVTIRREGGKTPADIIGEITARAEAAERRAEEAEAQAAAIRAALLCVEHAKGDPDVYACPSCGAMEDERHIGACNVGAALAADAGRALLDRLHAAEAKVARMDARKAAICGCVSCCSGHVAPDIEDACPDCHGSGAVIVEGGE